MKKLLDLVGAEPVRFVGAVQASLATAVLFGWHLSQDQIAGLVLALAAWLSFVTHKQVSPS